MKRLILCWALAAAPLAAQEMRLAVPYTWFVLPNGLSVILHEDHSTPSVTVDVWYHVGSGREKPGRTGFAHLFEHIMFEGSANVPEGKFDEWLEAAGGNNNGSTNPDRTNYFENVPSNALELALFLESDRMAYLLKAMSPAKVDGQRDVVKNERRQSYENRPYGMSSIVMGENLYPADHPYHWPTIGYMEDLSAASYEDVVDFFTKFYTPNNASLAIVGDIDPARTRALVEKWFGEVPRGAPVPPIDPKTPVLSEEKRLMFEDRVQLPRLYMIWHSPGSLTPGDAELDVVADVLAGGKNSRLYRRLVYEMQIAQDVSAYQMSAALGSAFRITATARAGHTLAQLERVIQEELDGLKREAPSQREVERTVNHFEASYLGGLESFLGKAEMLSSYFFRTGNPDYFNEDLARYRALDPVDIQAAVLTYLKDGERVVLSVVPQGGKELAAERSKEVRP